MNIQLSGVIDFDTYETTRKHILEFVKAHNTIAVDLSAVTYIDSAGLSCLVEGLQEAQQEQKNFTLLNPSDSVEKILTFAALHTVFTIEKLAIETPFVETTDSSSEEPIISTPSLTEQNIDVLVSPQVESEPTQDIKDNPTSSSEVQWQGELDSSMDIDISSLDDIDFSSLDDLGSDDENSALEHLSIPSEPEAKTVNTSTKTMNELFPTTDEAIAVSKKADKNNLNRDMAPTANLDLGKIEDYDDDPLNKI